MGRWADGFRPSPAAIGYWYLGVSVNHSQVLFNGKAHVGQEVTGPGSRVRRFSQFPVDDHRIECYC